ncbi:FHA domain-containing protein [Aggregatilinea lenta]|uniref:FHA domain-containing protein n=1 Tax=Aggregatilinea lenta TaxID=913108 RepID=UPI000E5A5AF6|nr:FHA domain-containing protein [Aggregatilinea lenta]
MADQVCVNCKTVNTEDATYCYACGHILPAGLQALATHNLPQSQHLQPQMRWGTAYFGDKSSIIIRIRHTNDQLETRFAYECVIGRAGGDASPDIDLTPFGAMAMGVSRRHVKLVRQSATIMVQDLDSVNGSFLNGKRLFPFQPRVLRNEDELVLGKLALRISFQRKPRTS